MKRLRQIRDYLIEYGNIPKRDFACHVIGSEQIPVESQTETGIWLFDDIYDAVIHIEDVSGSEYENIRLLLYEWFRENQQENEKLSLAGDFITDVLSLITVSVTLKDSVHIVPDPEGKIERDRQRWRIADPPNEENFI